MNPLLDMHFPPPPLAGFKSSILFNQRKNQPNESSKIAKHGCGGDSLTFDLSHHARHHRGVGSLRHHIKCLLFTQLALVVRTLAGCVPTLTDSASASHLRCTATLPMHARLAGVVMREIGFAHTRAVHVTATATRQRQDPALTERLAFMVCRRCGHHSHAHTLHTHVCSGKLQTRRCLCAHWVL